MPLIITFVYRSLPPTVRIALSRRATMELQSCFPSNSKPLSPKSRDRQPTWMSRLAAQSTFARLAVVSRPYMKDLRKSQNMQEP